jgi:hypothetical protein
LRGCLGTLVYLLIVLPLLVAFMGLAAVRSWAFDRNFYLSIIDDEAIYEAALNDATTEIESGETLQTDFGRIPSVAINAGLREVVTTDYLRTQARSVVDQVFNYLEQPTPNTPFVLSVDLQPIKEALNTPDTARRFSVAFAEALPACTAAQSQQASNSDVPLCREEGDSVEELAADVEAAIPAVVDQLPNALTFENEEQNLEVQPGVTWASILDGVTTGVIISGVVALVFWLLNGFIFSGNRRGVAFALAVTLSIPALMVLLAGLSINNSIVTQQVNTFWNQQTSLDPEVATALTRTSAQAIGRVGTSFIAAGAIPFLVAVGLGVFGAMLRSERDTFIEESPYEKPKRG